MTDEKKRLYMEMMAASNRMMMSVICPPGTMALLGLTWLIGPPGLFWLFWVTR